MPIERPVRVAAFDDQDTRAICEAFDSAWAALQARNSPLTLPGRAPSTREALAKRIIHMAQQGMLDVAALREDALQHLQKTRRGA